MKRWIVPWVVAAMMASTSVCYGNSEIKLASDGAMQWAEVWLNGTIFTRIVIADTVPVWRDGQERMTIWLTPCFEHGLFKFIVR